MSLNQDKVAEVAMALLSLTMFKDGQGHRAWKGMDWDVLEDLFNRGWIHDPKGKNKSVVFSDEGKSKALEFQARHLQ
ncbi:MAG: DUF6429 family protein [Planctomycetota bacterium]